MRLTNCFWTGKCFRNLFRKVALQLSGSDWTDMSSPPSRRIRLGALTTAASQLHCLFHAKQVLSIHRAASAPKRTLNRPYAQCRRCLRDSHRCNAIRARRIGWRIERTGRYVEDHENSIELNCNFIFWIITHTYSRSNRGF